MNDYEKIPSFAVLAFAIGSSIVVMHESGVFAVFMELMK